MSLGESGNYSSQQYSSSSISHQESLFHRFATVRKRHGTHESGKVFKIFSFNNKATLLTLDWIIAQMTCLLWLLFGVRVTAT